MPRRSIRERPQLARGLAVLLIVFGVAYYATLLYPDLPPAKLILGSAGPAYSALLNGLLYGLAGLVVVGWLYRGRS